MIGSLVQKFRRSPNYSLGPFSYFCIPRSQQFHFELQSVAYVPKDIAKSKLLGPPYFMALHSKDSL